MLKEAVGVDGGDQVREYNQNSVEGRWINIVKIFFPSLSFRESTGVSKTVLIGYSYAFQSLVPLSAFEASSAAPFGFQLSRIPSFVTAYVKHSYSSYAIISPHS